MKKFLFSFFAFCALVSVTLQGQEIRSQVLHPVEHSAGSSMAYRYEPGVRTSPPDGYVPFYISHFGRHGSRYHTTENIYRKFHDIFEEASSAEALTPFGLEVKIRIDSIFAACDGRAGQLTVIGEKEHMDIAARMYGSFPEVFISDDSASVFSRSTSSERVVQSMRIFDATLKSCASGLQIEERSGGSCNAYLNHYTPEYREYYENGPWKEEMEMMRGEWIRPERLIDTLFSDPVFVAKRISSRKNFMTELFSVASILQGSPVGVSLYDVFTEEEIFALWRTQNLNQYLRKGPSATGGELAVAIAVPLLRDFIACADSALAGNGRVADLRFGHGEGLVPLAALMRLSGADVTEADPEKVQEVWQDFRITPMAGNIQWIFYRNNRGRVLVRFLLNERDVTLPLKSVEANFYDWRNVRKFYSKIIEAY